MNIDNSKFTNASGEVEILDVKVDERYLNLLLKEKEVKAVRRLKKINKELSKEIKQMSIWNPWHGCHKKSSGCLNCYMYRRDAKYGLDSNIVTKTKAFNDGIRKRKDGSYFINNKDDYVYVCMTSDFFIEEADNWRKEIWKMIKERKEINFYIITKRIERFNVSLPEDWLGGYDNVTICVTAENQEMADERIPILLSLPIKHKEIIHEPMLEKIEIEKYLETGKIDKVICGGESGENARKCNYEWILNTRSQCVKNNVSFYFKQTGAYFIKNNKLYEVPRNKQLLQASKANINFTKNKRLFM